MTRQKKVKETADKDAAQKKAVKESVEKALAETGDANKEDIKDAKVTAIADVVYSGKAQQPEVSVKLGDTVLKQDTDYAIAYTNNTNVGEATVSIIGKGDYTGTIETHFKITAQTLGKLTVKNATATGAAVEVTGKDGAVVNSDNYTVSVSKNTDEKTVTVTVTGKTNYTGTLKATASIGTSTDTNKGQTTQVTAEPLYRVYNPNSGEHFYTKSSAERDYLVSVGWNNEGLGWNSPKTGTPVYRLYNPNAGDHHYTTNKGERDTLVSLGWNDEGIDWYAASKNDANVTPVYRQYNPNAKAGAHNFTTSKTENDYLAAIGWNAEGIAWYAIR